MKNTTWKVALRVTGIIFFIPIILSLIYKYSDIGSIGPVVLLYTLISIPVLIYVYTIALMKYWNKYFGVAAGIMSGLGIAILLINYFMTVTYYFGIYDYQQM